ncbi:MAG: DUF4440 domain-containing protein [bacterium]
MNATSSPDIDALIAAFYAAFDNRGTRAPATAALRAMFAPGGRITRVAPGHIDSWSIEEFIAPRAAMLTDGTLTDFTEWETEGATTVFRNIASRQSHYRKVGTMNGAPYFGGGQKFIQLIRIDTRWMITSVLWEDV